MPPYPLNGVPLPDNYAVMAPRPLTALLFPGQGSQTADMRELVARARPKLLEQAIEEVGADPFERVEEGTAFTQPALYCASLAGWAAAGRPVTDLMAGHSLGELAALAAAGSVSEADGLALAVTRGRVMQEAAENGPPGGMLAVLGKGKGIPALAERLRLTIANDNAPGQVVLSGPREALKEARGELKRAGLRTIPLRVRGAFHSPAMEPAVPVFRAALAEVAFKPPRVAVLSSTTARPFDDIRRRLAEALVRPVRWREALIALREAGARRFLEAGPGSVLTGLVRRTLDDVQADTIAEAEVAHA
jgi:[acyl-carrier-protein] S-malonyltransferase